MTRSPSKLGIGDGNVKDEVSSVDFRSCSFRVSVSGLGGNAAVDSGASASVSWANSVPWSAAVLADLRRGFAMGSPLLGAARFCRRKFFSSPVVV